MSTAVELQRRSTARLVAVAALAVAGVFTGILTGRVELVALGAPFAVILVGAVVMAERPGLVVDVASDADRVVAGEDIVVRVTISSSVPLSRVAVWFPHQGFAQVVEPADGRLVWVTAIGRQPVSVVARLQSVRWGIEALGPVRLEAAGPFGLVRWTGALPTTATLRVLPDDGTLRALLPNVEPRAASGVHVARRRGEGFEFAEVRQYREGDRLRSVNWYQTARRGELWVNEHHPEKSGDLVVLVDTFADRPSGGSASLERSVRVAWQVAMAHLAAHDRVGVVGFGGLPSWVTPGGGERARLAVIDRLLESHASWSDAQRSVAYLPRPVFPAGAQVLAVSGLHDQRMTGAIADLARRGHDTAVVVVSVDVGETTGIEPAALARRLWMLQLRERRRELERLGIPVVATSGGDPGDVLALVRARRRPTRRMR